MKVKTVKIQFFSHLDFLEKKNSRESSLNYENIDFLLNIHTAVRNFEPI